MRRERQRRRAPSSTTRRVRRRTSNSMSVARPRKWSSPIKCVASRRFAQVLAVGTMSCATKCPSSCHNRRTLCGSGPPKVTRSIRRSISSSAVVERQQHEVFHRASPWHSCRGLPALFEHVGHKKRPLRLDVHSGAWWSRCSGPLVVQRVPYQVVIACSSTRPSDLP